MMFRKSVYFIYVTFFIFICSLSSFGNAADNDLLKKDDISKIMAQIFQQHVDKKEMSTTILKHSFRNYIDQFDPDRIYLLDSEVEPFGNPSDNAMQMYVEQYKENNFSDYEKLNTIIQNAIERARNFRKEIEQDKARLLVEASTYPHSRRDEYYEDLHQHMFAKYPNELKHRMKENLIHYIQAEQHRFGDAAVKRRQDHLFSMYEEKMRSWENPYLYQNAKGEPLAENEQEHQFSLHVLKALAKSLDAHTSFFNPAEAYDMRVRLEKGYEGIGLFLQETLEGIRVTGMAPNGPAAKSGLIKVNDELVSIDGTPIGDSSLEEVMNKIHGEVGKSITLILKRNPANSSGSEEQYTAKLNREKIIVDEDRVKVSSEHFGDGIIGIIKLDSFYQNDNGISSEKDVKEAIHQLQQKGKLLGLVLDLRENSGGFLSQAVKVGGLFITDGVIVIAKYSNGEERYYRDLTSKKVFDGPLVILTSKLTASAAEIVAQALQDYGVAVIVGDEHTYGKGSIQSQTVTNQQSSSSYFKVTVGEYFTVSGKSPQMKGVLADIVVPSQVNHENIGEEYLDFPLPTLAVEPAYQDKLKDIQPSAKAWYLKYYLPYVQKKETVWLRMLPNLKENSTYRIAHNKNYQFFLKQIGIKTAENAVEEDPAEEELLAAKPKNFGREDLQLNEAVNITKDMVMLHEKHSLEPAFIGKGESTK